MTTKKREAEARNNKVPEIEALGKQMPCFVLQRAWERLSRGDEARAQLKRPSPSLLWRWLALSISVGGIGIGIGLAVWGWRLSWVWLLPALGCLGVAGLALVVGLAVDRVLPPAPRSDCQKPTWQGQKHPFFPFDQATGLVEYIPGQVWVAQIPLVFHGLQMGTRMTILRADQTGSLLIHSPIPLTPAILKAVEGLGEVRWIVAPNAIHHLFVGEWLDAYPKAEAWASPNLAPRRPDIPWTGSFHSSTQNAPWDREIVDFVVLKGHAFHQEVVLFHAPSRTLLLSDALENLGHRPETPLLLSWLFSWYGMSKRPTPPTDLKLSLSEDDACAEAIRAILAWDFQQIILAHGRLIEENAHDTFHDAWAFVLYRSPR